MFFSLFSLVQKQKINGTKINSILFNFNLLIISHPIDDKKFCLKYVNFFVFTPVANYI